MSNYVWALKPRPGRSAKQLRYHNSDCGAFLASGGDIGRDKRFKEDAKAQGYTPCKQCVPGA